VYGQAVDKIHLVFGTDYLLKPLGKHKTKPTNIDRYLLEAIQSKYLRFVPIHRFYFLLETWGLL